MPHYVNINGQRVEALNGCWCANAHTTEIKTSGIGMSEANEPSRVRFYEGEIQTWENKSSFLDATKFKSFNASLYRSLISSSKFTIQLIDIFMMLK